MNQTIDEEKNEILFPSSFDIGVISSNELAFRTVKDLFRDSLNKDFKQRNGIGRVIVNGETFEMTYGRMFLNLLLLFPLVKFKIHITKDDLFLNENFTQDSLETYFNHLLKRFKENSVKIDYDQIRQSFIETMNEMCDLSGEYNVKVGNSVSYRDLIRLEVEDPEADALFHPEIKAGAFNEIEKQFKDEGKKLIKYFESHPDTELHPFVTSKTGINIKQLCQAMSFIGLKPNMTGEVIPVVIKDNFLRGLSGLESYYINSCGTKKALTTNAKYTKKSGFTLKSLVYLNK